MKDSPRHFAEFRLPADEQSLVDRAGVLAREKFAPRADHYDRTATFPAEDFDDLFEAGFHALPIPTEFGGLGIGPLDGGAFTLWMVTKQLAKADLSLARCWEGHTNSLVMLSGLANDDQKRRYFSGVVEQGHRWASWSGEPQSRKPGEKERFGTTVEKVDGGYTVSGSKVFSTSATGAQRAILLVNSAGPGGARHASRSPDTLLLLACNLSDPSVSTDDSWWDPIGMRATVSHMVRFDRTFIPSEDCIGEPGEYLRGNWQALFVPHYAASFLGAAEAALDYTLQYVREQGKSADPYIQHRVARMALNQESAYLWLRRVAELWKEGRAEEARRAGSGARFLVEQLAESTLRNAIHACGARSLIRPCPLERIFRDLSLYTRHDNDDHILSAIGKALLGEEYDLSFHRS